MPGRLLNMPLCTETAAQKCFPKKKNVLIVVRIPANTHQDCDVISDQWTALYEERPPQRDFSWGPSILKEKVMVNLRFIRCLI